MPKKDILRRIELPASAPLAGGAAQVSGAGAAGVTAAGFNEIFIEEGSGIDVVGSGVALGGDLILIYHKDGSPTSEYGETPGSLHSTDVTDALSAAVSGDVIQLPAGTIDGDIELVAGVTLRGMGIGVTILTGQVSGADGARLEELSVTRTANDASVLAALIGPASGSMTVQNCDLDAQQSGAGSGYAISVLGGNVYMYDGRAVGSTAMTDEVEG